MTLPAIPDADRLTLRALVDAYALACDEQDGLAVAALFRADGVVGICSDVENPDLPVIVRRGNAEIASGAPALTRFLSTHHAVAQQVFTRWDSDTAQAVVYCTENHWYRRDDRERGNFVVQVRYVDRYERAYGRG